MSTSATLEALKSALPKKSWSQNTECLAPYLTEWRGRWQGTAPILMLPQSTEDVRKIVLICAQNRTPITLQGGNTGLVGGQIPQGEVLLSTTRLNKVRNINTDNMSLICEAGVTLKSAQDTALNHGLKFPLSLASEGSCTIGGNLSTNAGGVHVIKYGTARKLVYGVEAVLANGEIYNGLTALHKDNTGYDLSQLLLGAEGTLGIITAASLKLFPKPKETVRVMAAVDNPKNALELLKAARIGNHLAMFELIPRLGIDYVTAHIPGHRDPFKEKHPWYVLLEWEFSQTGQGQTLAETVLAEAFEQSLVRDAVIATSKAQANALLSLRENLSAAQKPIGATIKHDISVPIADVPAFIKEANAAVIEHVPGCAPLPFGHLGDGNIHYNIGQPKGMNAAKFMAKEPAINDIIYTITGDLGGSISAEHGIGILKKEQLIRRASPVKFMAMQEIKRALDPHDILNPRIIF